MGHGCRKLRKSVSDDFLVLVIGVQSGFQLAVLIVDEPLALLVETGELIHAEIADSFPDLQSLEVIERERALGFDFVIPVLPTVQGIGKTYHLVRNGGTGKSDGIREIPGPDRIPVQFYLHTGITHGADIGVCGREKIRRYRDIVVTEKILLGPVIIVDRTGQPVVKQGKVQSHIPVDTELPFEVRIGVLRCSPYGEPAAVVIILFISGHRT